MTIYGKLKEKEEKQMQISESPPHQITYIHRKPFAHNFYLLIFRLFFDCSAIFLLSLFRISFFFLSLMLFLLLILFRVFLVAAAVVVVVVARAGLDSPVFLPLVFFYLHANKIKRWNAKNQISFFRQITWAYTLGKEQRLIVIGVLVCMCIGYV